MKCIHTTLVAATAAIVLTVTPPAFSHDDIEVFLDNGRVATDGRVFESVFGESGIPYFTDDPGFEGDAGIFAPGTTIGFNIMSPLGLWNGDGFDYLDPSTQEFISIAFGPENVQTGNGFVPGFDFVQDASNGFDVHLGFTLGNGGGGSPADGAYLLELQLTSNNYDASMSFWIVFGNNIDHEMLDEVVHYVEKYIVPTPGAVTLLAMAGLIGSRRRRS